LVYLLIAQRAAPGADPRPGLPLPRGLAAAFAAVAAVALAIGTLQLFAAGAAADVWAWPLTPLTSHALSAWFLGVGTLAALTARDNDLIRSRPVMLGAAGLGILLAVAFARYESEVRWERATAWVFVSLILALVLSGTYGAARAARRG
jgi:hypothetical protein